MFLSFSINLRFILYSKLKIKFYTEKTQKNPNPETQSEKCFKHSRIVPETLTLENSHKRLQTETKQRKPFSGF